MYFIISNDLYMAHNNLLGICDQLKIRHLNFSTQCICMGLEACLSTVLFAVARILYQSQYLPVFQTFFLAVFVLFCLPTVVSGQHRHHGDPARLRHQPQPFSHGSEGGEHDPDDVCSCLSTPRPHPLPWGGASEQGGCALWCHARESLQS